MSGNPSFYRGEQETEDCRKNKENVATNADCELSTSNEPRGDEECRQRIPNHCPACDYRHEGRHRRRRPKDVREAGGHGAPDLREKGRGRSRQIEDPIPTVPRRREQDNGRDEVKDAVGP